MVCNRNWEILNHSANQIKMLLTFMDEKYENLYDPKTANTEMWN